MLKDNFLVVDDCVAHPDILRDESRSIRYLRRPMSPGGGLVSLPSQYAQDLGKKFASLARKKVQWDPGSGTYRKMILEEVRESGTMFMAHSDGSINFIAMLYLNLPEECQGGTAFYRHKETGLEGYQDPQAVLRALKKSGLDFEKFNKKIRDDSRDPSRWTRIDLVRMKFNRALIYDGWQFHSHVLDLRKFKESSVRLTFACFGSIPPT